MLGVSFAVYMINSSLEDAQANPIMTTIDTVDISNIPFPAVTVIPGEYPTINYKVDGFMKRLFDYVEFERYQTDDSLR